MCITSTCYALLTIISLALDSYSSIIRDDGNENDSDAVAEDTNDATIPVKKVLKALLASNCRKNDLFQIPLLVYTLLKVDKDRSVLQSAVLSSGYTAKKVKKLIETIIDARPHWSNGAAQEHRDYIIYQICKVLALLQAETTHQAAYSEEPNTRIATLHFTFTGECCIRCFSGSVEM